MSGEPVVVFETLGELHLRDLRAALATRPELAQQEPAHPEETDHGR